MSRETDVIVHKIDREKAIALIIQKKGFEPDPSLYADHMVVVNGRNGLATVMTEGVGWWADANGGIPINYLVKNSYGGGGYADITADELKTIISDETVNLADHIRSFGDRLETNFDLWRRYSLGYPQDKKSLLSDTILV